MSTWTWIRSPRLAACATFLIAASIVSSADAVPCKQTCGAAELCSPNGECVSKCNPGCAANELCSPDATCVSACNPGCSDSEVCSPERTCVSRCNPSCTGGAACLADGTCEAPAPVATPVPATRTLMVDSSGGGGGSHPNWTLFGVGTGIFGVGWIATGVITTVVCGNVGCFNSEPPLSFIPLFGAPTILALSADGMEGEQIGGLIAGQTVQMTGFILAIVGLATTVDSDDASIESPFQMGALPFVVTPDVNAGFTGLRVLGQF